MSLLNAFQQRVEALERSDRDRDEHAKQLESLSVQRQEALLATIVALEEKVEQLECMLEQSADARRRDTPGKGDMLEKEQLSSPEAKK